MNLPFILNLVFFQLVWFSSVVGAGAYGLHWLAMGAMIPLSVLAWFSPTRRSDLALATIALCVGLLIDNIWVKAGILAYPDYTFAPYWIGLLWVGLGLTINHSMAIFRDHTLIGSLVVGAFAPVTYLSGERFGAVIVQDLALTPLICVSWFVLFYGLAKWALAMTQAAGEPLEAQEQT